MSLSSVAGEVLSGRDKSGRDLFLFGAALTLCLYGILVLYPASAVIARLDRDDPDFFIRRQITFFFLGMGGFFVAVFVPLDLVRRMALPLMIGTLVLLVLVFVPGIGHSVSSSRETFYRWVGFGSVRFQPSEFGKAALIIYAASVLSRGGRLMSEYDIKRLSFPVAVVGALLTFIVLEPQYGTAVTMLVVVTGMIFIAGFPMIRLLLIGLSLVPVLYLLVVFWQYRLDRLKIWLDPYAHRHEGGYQLVTAFRAFHEGGFFGLDLASGFAHRYLTFGHTDFVLALLAEDYGLLGVLFLIGLYGLVLWRGYLRVRATSDPFAFMLGTGILLMLTAQAILNMAVVTGLVPTTGVSLPFVSYGGSSLIVTLAFSGLLVNVSRYADQDKGVNA